MLLSFWVISTIICLGIFLVAVISYSTDVDRTYILDKARMKRDTNIFRIILSTLTFFIPIINIVLALAYIFAYDEIKNKIIETYKEKGYIVGEK